MLSFLPLLTYISFLYYYKNNILIIDTIPHHCKRTGVTGVHEMQKPRCKSLYHCKLYCFKLFQPQKSLFSLFHINLTDGRSNLPTVRRTNWQKKTWLTDGHNLLLNGLIPTNNWNSIIHILLIKSLSNFIPTNVSISRISKRTGVVTQNSLLVGPRWGILLQNRTNCSLTSTEKSLINFRSVLFDIHRILTAIF